MPQDFNFRDQPLHEPLSKHASLLGRCEAEADQSADGSFTRREFVVGVGTIAATAMLERHAIASTTQSQMEAPPLAVEKIPIRITINGDEKNLKIDPRTSILDLLREDLKMTGTKKGCDHGQCGACTVLSNGRRINSCLALAVVHQGERITTIEGVASNSALSPVQQAFLDNDGYQCGYCTPGQICSAVALLEEARQGSPSFVTADLTKSGPVDLTAPEVRERMSGNICRCGAYPGIVAAVQQANKS